MDISVRLFSVRSISAAALGIFACAATPSLAQSKPEPAAIERTIPQHLPQASSAPVLRGIAREGPAEPLATGRFTLGVVNIKGATVFSKEELSRDFEPYLASEVDGSKLAEMAARITERYRHSGYLLSYATIPAQSVEAGMVRLAVVEGRIGNVTITGAGPDQAALEAMAAPLLDETPLRLTTLERTIGLIRDFPGLKVTDVALMRSDFAAGIYRLRITVSRDRTRALAYMDNRGTDSIGRLRYYSSLSLSSVALTGDELRVDAFAMPGRRFRYLYGQLLASVPVGHNGLRFTLAASKGDQYLHRVDRLDGDSTNFLAQFSYPVSRSRSLTMVGKVSLNDWRSWAAQHQVPTLRDHLRVARVGVEFSTETVTRLQGEFSLSRGLGFGGMTRKGDPLASRLDASGRFTKAAFTLQLSRPLSDDIRIQGLVSGQYSKRPLLSAEEFALGGNRIGRAFAFNTLTGHRGVGGAIELSYQLAQSKGRIASPTLFGFVDGGTVREAKSLAVTDRRGSLASVGVGTRFSIAGTAFSLEAGVPIAAHGQRKSVRLFLSTYRAF